MHSIRKMSFNTGSFGQRLNDELMSYGGIRQQAPKACARKESRIPLDRLPAPRACNSIAGARCVLLGTKIPKMDYDLPRVSSSLF